MKKSFSFATHINKKYSLAHSLLSALIGGDYKIAWLEIVFKVIAEVQIISIILSYAYEFLGTDSLDTFNVFVQNLASWITFRDMFSVTDNSMQSNLFLGVILGYLGSMVIYVAAVTLAHYLHKTLPSAIHKIWVNLSVVHFTFIFLLIHQYSLALLKAAKNNQVLLFGNTNTQVFMIIGALITCLNIFFGLAMSRFVYEPIKSQYVAAIRNTMPDLIGLAYKAIDVFLVIFVENISAQKFIRLALMVVAFSYRLKIYVTTCPYYYYHAMITIQGFNFSEFGLSFLNAIIILVNEVKTIEGSSIAYMAIIVVAFFLKMSSIRLEFMIKKYGMRSLDQIITRDDFYKKLLSLDYILEYGSISAQMEKKARESFTEYLFYGVIKAHKVTCKKEECGCNLILEKGKMADILPVKEDQRKLMRDFKFTLIQDLFEAFKDPEVKITLANFLFENKVDAYAAAITIIHSLKIDQGSIELKVVSTKLLEKIEKKVLSNYGSGIDVRKLVDYQNLSYNLRKAVEGNILNYLKFWEIYKGAEPNVKELFKISMETNREGDKLSKIWDNITKNFSRLSYRDHLLYGLYQSLTRASPYSAEKTLQKYFSFSALYSTHRQRDILLTLENISDPENVLIYISMQKEKLGTINFATRNIEDLLGYTSFELMDKNINELMSKFYREKHTKLLLRHIYQSKTSLINKNRQIYIRKKDGYIIPAVKYVSIFPYFQKQLIYVGIFRPIQTYDEFILVQADGIIDSYTNNIAKMLNLDVESKRRPRLKYICPELFNFHLAFNYLRNGQYTKLRQMSFSKRDLTLSNKKGSSTMHSKSVYTHSGADDSNNTSFVHSETDKKNNTTTLKESKDFSAFVEVKVEEEKEELLNENEFDDWRRIYELFISTGVPVIFRKYDRYNKSGKIPPNSQFEFTTIILEENVLGANLRVFRLQTTTADTDQEEEASFQPDENDATQEDRESPTLHAMKTIIGKEDNNNILKDLTRKQTNTNQSDLVMNGGITPVGWEKSGPLNNSVSLIKPTKGNLNPGEIEVSGNFDLSEDHEVSAFNDDTLSLKNPFTLQGAYETVTPALLKDKLNAKFQNEGRPGSDSHLLTDGNENMLAGKQQLREANQERGVHLLVQPTFERSITGQSFKSQDPNNSVVKGPSSSGVKPSLEQNSEKKADLKRFFESHNIMHVDQNNNMGERSSAQSSAQAARINAKIERAIYSSETDKTLKTLNWIVILYCVVNIVLLVYDQIITRTNLDRLKANVEVQKFSTQRLYLIVEINRRARIINVIQRGMAPSDRLDDNGDARVTNLQRLNDLANDLSHFNTEIRLSINKIDSIERQRFYEEILIKERGDPTNLRYMNSFDTCTEIVNAAIRLNKETSLPTANDPDLEFILGNTLNDLVLKNEEVTTILLDDNNISLQKIETTIFTLLIIVVAVAVFIFLMVSRSELKFIRRKAIFLDSFFRIKDHEIEENLFIVKAFSTSLLESDREDLFMQKVADNNFVMVNKKLEPKKNQYRDFKAKSANMKGLDSQTYVNLGFIFVFLLIFALIFGILFISFFSHKDLINKLMLRAINTNIKLFQFGLVFSSLYEYITEDGQTQIKNAPIGPEWERTYQILTQSVDFFSAFNDQDGEFNSKTLFLLNGDLCPSLFTDRDCYNEASGIGSRGILGINGFILKGLRSVKDYYDSSNRSLAAKTTALTIDDFLNCELAYYYYTTRSYSELDSLLSTQFFLEMDGFSSSSLTIGIVGIVGLLILARAVWMKVIERMENERKSFRGIMRMIPVNVILNNRYLKNYLISNSQNILDSVKNRI